jgi:hypothetical protein
VGRRCARRAAGPGEEPGEPALVAIAVDGKAEVKACVRVPAESGVRRYRQEVRTFGTMTGQLLGLVDWLAHSQVSLVVMEATGDYWKTRVLSA